ncbi:MAG: DUF4221 family protein, partial [Bacteroidota bacterium]
MFKLIGLYILVNFFIFSIYGQAVSVSSNGDYSLPLDNQTGFEADFMQLFTDNEDTYLSLGYRYSRKINIYDFKAAKLVKSITFEREGPNGIGGEMGGYYIESFNEIYVYSYWERRLNVFNESLEIIDKTTLSRSTTMPIVECSFLSSIVKKDTNLYFTGTLENHFLHDNHRPVVKLSTNSKSFELVGRSPAKTYEGNFLFKHRCRILHNQDDNIFALNFDVSDSIFLTDFDDKYVSKLAKADKIDSVKPFSSEKGKLSFSQNDGYSYMGKGAYVGLLYDKYRKLYYRIAYYSRSLDEIYKIILPSYVLVVLDKDLNKIGEINIPDKFFPEMSFVGEAGLYVFNKKRYDEVSD